MNKQLYFAVALLTATVAPAQPQGPGPRPGGVQPQESGPIAKEFEVASIKPIDPNMRQLRVGMQPGGRFTAAGVNASFLIQRAYDVMDFQIVGGPGWIRGDRYEVNAKADGAINNLSQLAPLFKKLLADRFKLEVALETKEMPVYALVVGKGGLKMKENNDPNSPSAGQIRVGRGQIVGNGMDMGMLARQLSQALGRQVIDRTGLTGNYDFTLNFTPEDGAVTRPPGDGGGDAPTPSADGAAPSLFTAVQELGLKLDASKGQVPVVSIIRIEKPSEN